MWTWLYDEKRVISASRPPRSRVIQPWMSNNQTLPRPNVRRSTNNTGVPAALRPFAGNGLRHQPATGAAGGAPEAHSQGIANQLAAFPWTGSRRGSRLDLDATTSQGDAGQQGGTGSVLWIGGDPEAPRRRAVTLPKPEGQSGDLGGRVLALQQLRHELEWWRGEGAADQE
jgi:hypothetical protein